MNSESRTASSAHYVLTLAPPEAERETRGKSGSGQGELIDALQKSPMARAERESYKRRDIDTSYLCRFDGSDYCQWFGRKSDGHFHPLGRIMQIVKTASGAVGDREGDAAGSASA